MRKTIKGVQGVERTAILIVLSSAKQTSVVSLPEERG